MLEAMVRQFLYHPEKLPENAAMPPWAADADEVWLDADGTRVHALHWPAPPGRPTLLYLHGNAQTVVEWSMVRGELEALECGLFLPDYPGYGKSGGAPSEASLYAAGEAALAWLGQRVGLERVVVLGKSLGGGVASGVVQGKPLLGLILESTFRSVPRVASSLFPMVPLGALKSERYDTERRIGTVGMPVLVVHGTRDEVVPVVEGRMLYALASDPRELWLVEGAGHNDVSQVAGAAYGATLRRWLDAHG